MQRPKIDPDEFYSTRQIAELAGRNTTTGIRSVSMLLLRHNIGRILGNSRVVPGSEVPRVLTLIETAKRDNPDPGKARKGKRKRPE